MANKLLNNDVISPEQLSALTKELGVTQSALEKLLDILQHQNISYQENDYTALRIIAKRYLKLLKKLTNFQSKAPDMKVLLSQMVQVLKQGEFDKAEVLINQAKTNDLLAAKNLLENVNKRLFSAAAWAAGNGELTFLELKYSKAAQYFQEAAEIVPAEFAENLVHYLNHAGESFYYARNYSEAEPLYLYSLVILEKALGKDHSFVTTILGNLAELYQIQGRDNDAEFLYLRVSEIHCKRSLAIFEQSLGKEHPTTQNVKENLEALQAKMC